MPASDITSDATDPKDERLQIELLQYQRLMQLGRVIVSEMDMDRLFTVVIGHTRQFMNTEICSLFVHDPQKKELWSFASTDLGRQRIRISDDTGIAGTVFQKQSALTINDAYADPRFCSDVDRETGTCTRNILCVPLINRRQRCIGTLQVLNKIEGDFSRRDLDLLTSVGHYVTIALENSKLYDDLKLLDKAKERIINHLSHELKTPLAIIGGVLGRQVKMTDSSSDAAMLRSLNRGQRQLQRLFGLQEKIDDILNHKVGADRRRILDLISAAADLVAEAGDSQTGTEAEFLHRLSRRVRELFSPPGLDPQLIALEPFCQKLVADARAAMGGRAVQIDCHIGLRHQCTFDRQVLATVCGGLLKNAIENTPDLGGVTIRSERQTDGLRLSVHDTGVGITTDNQQLIFGGFFHTQMTEQYTSKSPYAFNAGGTGSDLLRIKVLSERLGFKVGFESRRCRYLPTDASRCPGHTDACQHIQTPADCSATGGSVFRIDFPAALF